MERITLSIGFSTISAFTFGKSGKKSFAFLVGFHLKTVNGRMGMLGCYMNLAAVLFSVDFSIQCLSLNSSLLIGPKLHFLLACS